MQRNCGFRGCEHVLWTTSPQLVLEQSSSGATCGSCRRVTLCLKHLGHLVDAQGSLCCPNCQGEAWALVTFEPSEACERLAVVVLAAGGRLEERWLANPLPPGLMLVRSSQCEPGEQFVGPTVVMQGDGEFSRIRFIPGESGACVVEGTASGAARLGDRALVAHRTRAGVAVLTAYSEGLSLRLAHPERLEWTGPCAIDRGRWMFHESSSDGRCRLRLLRWEGDNRVRTLVVPAVAEIFHTVGGIWARASLDGVVVATGGRAPVVAWLRDDEPNVQVLARLDDVPTTLVAARRARAAAWIGADGRVFAVQEGLAPTLLGTSTLPYLAMSPEGTTCAFVAAGRLQVVDLNDVRVVDLSDPHSNVTCPVPDDLCALDWLTPVET